MSVNAKHVPYIVAIGTRVVLTPSQHVRELAGMTGRIHAKSMAVLRRDLTIERPVPDNMSLVPVKCAPEQVVYFIRVEPPVDGLPTEVWTYRCGFVVP